MLVAAVVVVATGVGAAVFTTVTAQTRVDPATGAPIGAAAPRPSITAAPAAINRPRTRVDWQGAVGGLRQSGASSDTLSANLDKAEVDATRVPILLPNDPKLTAGARIYSFGDYYTITADAPGAGISLSGTTAIVPVPGKPLKIDAVGPEMLTVQRTVDGQLASFMRYGVLYTVEIRCEKAGDLRCVDDNYVLGLVGKTTTVVMGKAARAEAGLGG